MEELTGLQAAELLGVSINELEILRKQGILHLIPRKGKEGLYGFSTREIKEIKSHSRQELLLEIAGTSIESQKEPGYSVTITSKVLLIATGILWSYILLVFVFTALFAVNPFQTAVSLGFVKTNTNISIIPGFPNTGAVSEIVPEVNSTIQMVLHPIGIVSLELVKYINPGSYAQIQKYLL